jgi:hypothetical protein
MVAGGGERQKLQVLNHDCREMREEKFMVQTSAGKVIASIYWDS